MKLDDALLNLVRKNVQPEIPASASMPDEATAHPEPARVADDIMAVTSFPGVTATAASPTPAPTRASIPLAPTAPAATESARFRAATGIPMGANLPRAALDMTQMERTPHLAYTAPDPSANLGEAYRMIRTRLYAMHPAPASVLVTSCLPGEGKTVTAANLALFMAKDRSRRVCLLDLDLRTPGIAHLLGLPEREKDVLTVLRGRSAPEAAMTYSEDDNLHILPAFCRNEGGSGYLESSHMGQLLDWLHARFDMTVIDTCSAANTSDPAVLGPSCGGVALVVRAGRVKRTLLKQTCVGLEEVGCRLLGAVLNDA